MFDQFFENMDQLQEIGAHSYRFFQASLMKQLFKLNLISIITIVVLKFQSVINTSYIYKFSGIVAIQGNSNFAAQPNPKQWKSKSQLSSCINTYIVAYRIVDVLTSICIR